MCSPLGMPAQICILAELLSTGVTQNNVNFVNFKCFACVLGGGGGGDQAPNGSMEMEAWWRDGRVYTFSGQRFRRQCLERKCQILGIL